MKDLQILLLGPPEIRLYDKTIDIQRRTPRALLFYLASQGGLVGREEILPLFWEDESDYYARRRLSDTLSRLRASLPVPDLLIAESDLVGLDSQRVFVDQVNFLELIDHAGRIPWQIPTSQPLPEQASDFLRRAASLWRSPHYLAGANLPSSPALDEWLTRTTQRMELLLVRVLERLAQHAQVIGDQEQALEFARQALAVDDLNEDLHYIVLTLLTDLDRMNEAREHLDNLEEMYRREYDDTPPTQLAQFFRKIQQGARRADNMEAAPAWNIRPTVKVPFVGRRNILERLQRHFVKGGGVLIFGESGQGKTRLTQEFSDKVAPPARLILATCRPAESNLPFQPIIELLRNNIFSEDWLELPEVWARYISLLLPELTSTRAGFQPPVFEPASEIAPGQARSQILEAIRQLFLAISRERRLLLCLDDAHWSDEATLATVGYLLERPPFDHQAFFLAAARQEEENPHLHALIASLQQSSRLQVIPLSRLSEPEISELASHVIGFEPSGQLTRVLSDETGGNPFILLESLRSLFEKGALSDTPVHIPLAQSVQSLISARLQKLSLAARKVLDVAAIIGGNFNTGMIRDVTQETHHQIVEALEDLERRQFIEPVAVTSEILAYRLGHEKIRETVLTEMSPLRAQLLHRQVAQAMEISEVTADQAAVIAQHYELAGEISTAFKYWIRAGRRARQLFSSADALSIFSHAESLIGRASDLTNGEIHDLFSDWTEVAYEVEDAVTVQRINAHLLNLGQERNSPLLTGTALDGMSDACMASNRYEEGLAYTDQAIPYLKQSGDLYELMDTLNHRGVFLYMLNQVDESINTFQEVLSLGADSHDPQVWRARANAYYQIAVANLLAGWPEIAQLHAQRSLADYSALKRINGQITAYSALAIAHYFLGNYPQALQESQLGIELAMRTQAWRMLGYLHAYRGMIELAMGNIDATIEHAEIAIELGERYNHQEIASGGYRILGDLRSWLRKPQSSVEYYQLATKGSLDQFLWIDARFRLGFAQVLCGQVETGKDIVDEVISFSERKGMGIVTLPARLSQLYIHRHLSEWRPARSLAMQLYQDAMERSIPTVRLSASNILGELALQDGDTLTAIECFQDTSRAAAKLRHPWIEIQSLTLLHKALNQANRPDPAPHHQIENLLQQIAVTTHNEPIKQSFQEYRQQILQSSE